MSMTIASMTERIADVQAEIERACHRAGRSPDSVTLIAVSKTHPPEDIATAVRAGLRQFGENRVEEAIPKMAAVAERVDEPLAWHMIGHVQSRKAEQVADYFDVVHSIDRLKIARRLSARAAVLQREIPVLLECNVSGETAKYGYAAADWACDADVRAALIGEVAAVAGLPGLRIEGLMTVGPLSDSAESVRPVFASLRGLRDLLREAFPTLDWHHLSMGMSGDFEVAIEEGATWVRIGRAIFGTRA